MKIDIFHHASAEDRERARHISKSIAVIREALEMISPKIQDALDRIRNTQSLVASVKQASDVQNGQIATLTAKVTDLQAKLDAGGTIGADDIAGLAEISSDIDNVNAQLQSAIPANTGNSTPPTGQQASAPPTGGEGQPASASAPGDANAPAVPDPNGNPPTGDNPIAGQPAPIDPATQAALDARVADGEGAKPQPLAGTGQA